MVSAIATWERNNKPGAARRRSLYEFLYTHLYNQYEPTKRGTTLSSEHFIRRIDEWLLGFDKEEDRWAAFCSIEYLFFVGLEEFAELYRVACDHIIVPWLIDEIGADLFGVHVMEQVEAAMASTWVCPVTDSLRINSFLHLTGIAGKPYRPDWHSLSQFGDKRKILRFARTKGINRLVLLEDFSGSGRQFSTALRFAARAFEGEILAVPLIICEPGDNAVRSELRKINRGIRYAPVSVIPKSCLVQNIPSEGEPRLFTSLRRSLLAAYRRMGRPNIDGKEYGHSGIGSLIALYSNCPNNTPPMFHRSGKRWSAIFPRANRF